MTRRRPRYNPARILAVCERVHKETRGPMPELRRVYAAYLANQGRVAEARAVVAGTPGTGKAP